jgi:hypothetical protein
MPQHRAGSKHKVGESGILNHLQKLAQGRKSHINTKQTGSRKSIWNKYLDWEERIIRNRVEPMKDKNEEELPGQYDNKKRRFGIIMVVPTVLLLGAYYIDYQILIHFPGLELMIVIAVFIENTLWIYCFMRWRFHHLLILNAYDLIHFRGIFIHNDLRHPLRMLGQFQTKTYPWQAIFGCTRIYTDSPVQNDQDLAHGIGWIPNGKKFVAEIASAGHNLMDVNDSEGENPGK